MDVVILAGGRCGPDLRAASGVEFRAELPIDGRPILEIVVEAAAPLGEPIVVGGPQGLYPRQFPGGNSFLESLAVGLAHAGDEVLIVNADLPRLTTAGLEDFLGRCDRSAALNYPIIRLEDCERAFPGMRRTSLRLSEGRFTGGGIGLVRTELMLRSMPILERAYAARKRPIELARIVGMRTLWRLVLGALAPSTLSIAFLEGSVGRFLQAPLHAVITPCPELGADIDNAEQYRAFTGSQHI